MKKIVLDTNCHTAFLTGDAQVPIALAAAEIVFLSMLTRPAPPL